LQREMIREQYEAGRFFFQENPASRAGIVEGRKSSLSLDQYLEIESLLKRINGKDCSACGSPGCRGFAEDVVRGRATLNQCVLLQARGE